jgi:hypothetical protein
VAPYGVFHVASDIMGKNQHVVPHNGQWAVRGAGNGKVTSTHRTQQEAIDAGRTISRNQGVN